jgi:phospholipid-binding lipoprotein MlaA
MKRTGIYISVVILCTFFLIPYVNADSSSPVTGTPGTETFAVASAQSGQEKVTPTETPQKETENNFIEEEGKPLTIADPIYPWNKAMYHFNDKFYFWILKPAASGYKAILPEDIRIGVSNFFSNVTTPVRFVNCLLQANFICGGTELFRFLVNSTFGLGGFLDPAKTEFHVEKADKDFGQTLGVYGMKPIFYINWPILGPSTLRETIGFIGDLSFDPRTYLGFYYAIAAYANTGGWVLDKVNETSLAIGEYEDFKKSALDPYVALKDAYYQYRQYKIKER